MLHCWNEDPLKRPTFTYLREHLDRAISTAEEYITFNVSEENRYYDIPSFKNIPSECEEDEVIIKELMNRPIQVKTIDELKQMQQKKRRETTKTQLYEKLNNSRQNVHALVLMGVDVLGELVHV